MTSLATIAAAVYPSISFAELGRVLKKYGFDIEDASTAEGLEYRVLSEPGFRLRLTTPSPSRPGEFALITTWSRITLPLEAARAVEQRLRRLTHASHVMLDKQGRVLATQSIVIAGGITEYYLRDQFWYWRQDLLRLHEAARRELAALSGRTLH